MNEFQHLRVDRDSRGVMTVTIDVVGRPFNIFVEGLFRELERLVGRLKQDQSTRLIVFRSGKPNGFFAGADVHQIHELANPAEADAFLRVGQDLFEEIERLPAPTVVVIHGLCLGGGLEFSLACTHRVARNDAATRIGAPETQIGLIPGWGGTQRLPRVVGLAAAIDMILDGNKRTAEEARKVGLVDALLSPELFEEELAKFVDNCLEGRQPKRNVDVDQPNVLQEARQQIAGREKQSPALAASLNAIEIGVREGIEAGLAAERSEFSRVLFDHRSRNLLEVFEWRDLARKRNTWVADDVPKGRPIRTVGVIGGGTMGSGIAHAAAAQGCSVLLMEQNEELVQKGLDRIRTVTQQAVRRHLMTSADAERLMASITPTTDLQALAKADLVIEAVVERLDVKLPVFAELDRILPAETLLTSNTSALSISTLAAATKRPDRIGGLHFFNPVHRMPLVEIVRCPATSDATIASLVDFSRALGKVPIVVAEGPGFLANRVLYPYLDEAVRLLQEGVPAGQIDLEMKRFGMPMGPFELLDLIGLDVMADIGETMRPLIREESPTIRTLTDMVARGRKGQKSGAGFYDYKDGRRSGPSETAPLSGSVKLPAARGFGGETLMGIQQRMILSMINATADAVQEGIVAEGWMADLGMVLGLGFPQFRGGPMSLIDQWGREHVAESLRELSQLCGPRFGPSAYFGAS
jgi:3-hydroxyacyl-CoA dehydrogenase/enoyl-CoA hydratase/3-hydroxybutyryl-CoA epimerase